VTAIGTILGILCVVLLLAVAGAASFGLTGAVLGLFFGIVLVFGAAKALEAAQDADRFDSMG